MRASRSLNRKRREFESANPTARSNTTEERRRNLCVLLNRSEYGKAKRLVRNSRSLGIELTADLQRWCADYVARILWTFRFDDASEKVTEFQSEFGFDRTQHLARLAESAAFRVRVVRELRRRANDLPLEQSERTELAWQLVRDLQRFGVDCTGKDKEELCESIDCNDKDKADLLKLLESVDFADEVVDILASLMPRRPLAARAAADSPSGVCEI